MWMNQVLTVRWLLHVQRSKFFPILHGGGAIMHRLLIVLLMMALVSGCGARGGSNQPTGVTGTGGGGGTTGTGTAAPTGTVGTGATSDPAGPGAVIPKEGESAMDHNDSAITATVVARLKEAGHDSIDVKTDDGVVTLKGTVSNQEQIEQIIKMVQGLPDVESVTSELKVR
jgi:hypothetical protein